MFVYVVLAVAVLALSTQRANGESVASFPSKVPALGTYKVSDVTVSGVSAGGYMAVQMHIAYSAVVNGSAIFAAGPFFCAEANLIYAEDKCMATYMGTPDVEALVKYTATQSSQQTIDKTSYLKDDRVYLFSGKGDSVVDQQVVKSLQTYYQYYVDVSNIVADYNVNAEHCLPTVNYGEPCGTLASPYIGKCNFDGAYMGLSTLYGFDIVAGKAVDANLLEFDQTPFFDAKGKTSLGDLGYIYVPTACAAGATCSLHISFHGCKQDLKSINNQYATDTGFNSWAEANNIIVLYPYVEISKSNPSNPNACWDWWAYTGKDYSLKSGSQMKFVKALMDTIMGVKA